MYDLWQSATQYNVQHGADQPSLSRTRAPRQSHLQQSVRVNLQGHTYLRQLQCASGGRPYPRRDPQRFPSANCQSSPFAAKTRKYLSLNNLLSMSPVGYAGSCLNSRRCVVQRGRSFYNSQSASAARFRTAVAAASHERRRQQRCIRYAAVAEAVDSPVASVLPLDGAISSSPGAADTAQPLGSSDRPIRVGDKPAANALLRRLETTPQTIIRAVSNSDQHTYKTITTIATAQKQLKQPGQVLLYVPFTKATIFTALVLPVSDAVQQHTALNFSSSSGNASTLSVKANTNSKALANTLTFDLIKKGPVTLTSAGAAAAAKAAAALALVREQMLTRGYELGVLPRFAEGPGRDTQITILTQQVVLQALPAPRVRLPSNPKVPLNKAAAKAQSLLQKQRRVQLLLQQNQLNRLTDVAAQIMAGPLTEQQQQQQQEVVEDEVKEQQQQGEGDTGRERGRSRAGRAGTGKKRLLLIWPPSTTEQLLESLEVSPLAAAAAVEASPADPTIAPAAATQTPRSDPTLDPDSLLSLQLRLSRLTYVPSPRTANSQQGSAVGNSGFGDLQKPAVATAESSVTGLAGAIEARVYRSGAAWLWSDGTEQGNTTAWSAYLSASNKMDAADGAGGLLALVDVQAPAAAAASAQQQKQIAANGAGVGQRLKMLIMRYDDIAKSILQFPNTPMEVSVTTDLWPLLKFATAANTFLPVSAQTGSGALLLLPAVLPALEPDAVAADYRFEDQNAKQQMVPYAIRLQRFTGNLAEDMQDQDPQQLRVSLNTDPIKLRDAIVAKVLQQEAAIVRFVGPVGRAPPLLTIAMAAVAAARVRLQQKGAGFDVGVMPYAEALLPDQGTAALDAAVEGTIKRRTGPSRGKQANASSSSSSQAGRVVYSLRLVPLPPVTKLNGNAAAAERFDVAL